MVVEKTTTDIITIIIIIRKGSIAHTCKSCLHEIDNKKCHPAECGMLCTAQIWLSASYTIMCCHGRYYIILCRNIISYLDAQKCIHVNPEGKFRGTKWRSAEGSNSRRASEGGSGGPPPEIKKKNCIANGAI